MSNEARPSAPARPDDRLVLHGEGCTARVRPWSFRDDTAHLMIVHQRIAPTEYELAAWCDEIADAGFTSVRTNAIGETMRARAESAGFVTVQELALLEYRRPRNVALTTRATVRLAADDDGEASAIDQRAFGTEWGLDERNIAGVRTATPHHRARRVDIAGRLVGYAISGRDRRQGFVQRVAVDPEHQRSGVGVSLVLDALRWLAFWRVDRVLVNTAVDNIGALSLYHRVGFRTLPERLRVFERELR